MPDGSGSDTTEIDNYKATVLLKLQRLEPGDEVQFPSSLSSVERKIVHDIAQSLQLKHKSMGKGSNRHLVVSTGGKSLQKVAIIVSYVGTRYVRARGVEYQHESEIGDTQLERFSTDSVQGHLFTALDRVRGISPAQKASEAGLISYSALGRPPAFSSVGRTDKGAHALNNLMSIAVEPELVSDQSRLSALAVDLNAELPADIRVLGVALVDNEFQARKYCDRKRYEYLVPIPVLFGTGARAGLEATSKNLLAVEFFQNAAVGWNVRHAASKQEVVPPIPALCTVEGQQGAHESGHAEVHGEGRGYVTTRTVLMTDENLDISLTKFSGIEWTQRRVLRRIRPTEKQAEGGSPDSLDDLDGLDLDLEPEVRIVLKCGNDTAGIAEDSNAWFVSEEVFQASSCVRPASSVSDGRPDGLTARGGSEEGSKKLAVYDLKSMGPMFGYPVTWGRLHVDDIHTGDAVAATSSSLKLDFAEGVAVSGSPGELLPSARIHAIGFRITTKEWRRTDTGAAGDGDSSGGVGIDIELRHLKIVEPELRLRSENFMKQKAEKQEKKRVEWEQARKEAEEQAKTEADEEARVQAEEMVKKEAEARVRKAAWEEVRKEAEEKKARRERGEEQEQQQNQQQGEGEEGEKQEGETQEGETLSKKKFVRKGTAAERKKERRKNEVRQKKQKKQKKSKKKKQPALPPQDDDDEHPADLLYPTARLRFFRRLKSLLRRFEGEKRMHNFSQGVSSTEGRSRRRVLRCNCRGSVWIGPEQTDCTGNSSSDGGWGVGTEFVALSFGAHRDGFLFEQVRTMVGLLVLTMREETIIDDDEDEEEDAVQDEDEDKMETDGRGEVEGNGASKAEGKGASKAERRRNRQRRDEINGLLELSFHPDSVLKLPLAPMEGLYLVEGSYEGYEARSQIQLRPRRSKLTQGFVSAGVMRALLDARSRIQTHVTQQGVAKIARRGGETKRLKAGESSGSGGGSGGGGGGGGCCSIDGGLFDVWATDALDGQAVDALLNQARQQQKQLQQLQRIQRMLLLQEEGRDAGGAAKGASEHVSEEDLKSVLAAEMRFSNLWKPLSNTAIAGTDVGVSVGVGAGPAYARALFWLRWLDRSGRWPESTDRRKQVIQDRAAGKGDSFAMGMMPAPNYPPRANQQFPQLLLAVFALERALMSSMPVPSGADTKTVGLRERIRVSPSSTIAVNRHAQFKPHKDSGSGAGQGVSLIVGLGDFTGGETVVEGEPMAVRYRPLEFNGWTQQHWTLPFEGERFSLVWFTPKGCEGMRRPLDGACHAEDAARAGGGSEGSSASLDCGLENMLPVNLGGMVAPRGGSGAGSSGSVSGVDGAVDAVPAAAAPAAPTAPSTPSTPPAPVTTSAIVLSSGFAMPIFGFGTFRLSGEQCARSVADALAAGYRAIDTAASYRNHAQVREGIARSGVRRGEVFITSKVPPQSHGRAEAYRCCLQCLQELGTDYLDLLLVHWPGQAGSSSGGGGDGGGGSKHGKHGRTSNTRSNEQVRVDTWLALQDLYFEGRCRSIGVSNFEERHLESLLQDPRVVIVPQVNQFETHPYLGRPSLRQYCLSKGIVPVASSPLGGDQAGHANDRSARCTPLRDLAVVEVARKHGRSSAQVLLRWAVARQESKPIESCVTGQQYSPAMLPVIAKSSNSSRLVENAQIFDFELDTVDLAKLADLENGTHFTWDPGNID
jgi:tRNA pseudouridine(38-40) synthase